MTKVTNPDPTPNASIPKAGVDLGDFDTVEASNKGAEIELVSPVTKQPLGVFIGVLGKHSDTFRELVSERTSAKIKADAFARKRGKDPELPTTETVEDEAVQLIAACATHWRTETYGEKGEVLTNEPHIIIKGEKLTFNAKNALEVFKRMIWMREQVDAGIGDLGNFIKG